MSQDRVRTGVRSERGTVLILVTMGLVAFCGFASLAIDTGYYFRHRRIMQTAADAGAIAGAAEISRGRQDLIGGSARTETSRNGFTHGQATTVVTVYNPPATGFYAGDPQYVEVLVQQDVASFFMRVLGINSLKVPARAVAGVIEKNPGCVYALDPSEEKALTVTSGSDLTTNCKIISNSTAYNSLNVESGSEITSPEGIPPVVTGGANITGSSVTPAPETYVPPSPDPLQYLDFPSHGACNYTDFKVSSGSFVIAPGVYCGGITIASGATATFTAGQYYLVDGGLQVQSGSTVTGTDVQFFNTGGEKYQPIRIESNSSATFSAPTDGDYPHILFYQDPDAGKPGDVYMNLIQSNVKAEFTGILYFPTQILAIGTSGSTTNINNGGMVARTIIVDSNSKVNVSNDPASGGSNPLFPFKRLALVE